MPLYRQHVEVTKSGKSEGTFLMCGSVELHQTGGEGSQTIPSRYILFQNFEKVASFLHKGRRQTGRCGKRLYLLFCSVNFNIGHGTEKCRRLFQSASTRHTYLAAVWHWWAQRSSRKVFWRINKKHISRPDRRTLWRHSSYRYGCETSKLWPL